MGTLAYFFLLLGTGCYLMLSLRFLPLKNLPAALRRVFLPESWKGTEGKGVSSFSSLTTELAATIGTGNIVGVATAMVLGGPGALFWMLLSGIIGLSTKLVESTLCVRYRVKNQKGGTGRRSDVCTAKCIPTENSRQDPRHAVCNICCACFLRHGKYDTGKFYCGGTFGDVSGKTDSHGNCVKSAYDSGDSGRDRNHCEGDGISGALYGSVLSVWNGNGDLYPF